jgi:hypothetical protein
MAQDSDNMANTGNTGGHEGSDFDPLRVQAQQRADPEDRAQIDLSQDTYTPEEAALVAGTTTDRITQAVRAGDLPAQQAGNDIVSVTRADLATWMKRDQS